MKTQEQHIGKPNKLRVISTNGSHGAHQGFSVEPGESYTFEIDLHRPAGMNKEINVVIWKNIGPSGVFYELGKDERIVEKTKSFNSFS